MPGPLPTYPIQLTPEQEAHLQHLSTCYTAPYAEVQRRGFSSSHIRSPPGGTRRSPGRWAAVSILSSAGGSAGL